MGNMWRGIWCLSNHTSSRGWIGVGLVNQRSRDRMLLRYYSFHLPLCTCMLVFRHYWRSVMFLTYSTLWYFAAMMNDAEDNQAAGINQWMVVYDEKGDLINWIIILLTVFTFMLLYVLVLHAFRFFKKSGDSYVPIKCWVEWNYYQWLVLSCVASLHCMFV